MKVETNCFTNRYCYGLLTRCHLASVRDEVLGSDSLLTGQENPLPDTRPHAPPILRVYSVGRNNLYVPGAAYASITVASASLKSEMDNRRNRVPLLTRDGSMGRGIPVNQRTAHQFKETLRSHEGSRFVFLNYNQLFSVCLTYCATLLYRIDTYSHSSTS